MKNPSEFIILLEKEMQYRNYSPRSVDSYIKLMSQLENRLGIPLDKISADQFKTYLHGRIQQDHISVLTISD